MSHPSYNTRPTSNDKDATVLTSTVAQLCRKYGLTTPTEQSTLLTMLYQLQHNNTIGWSLSDITERFETLLRLARRSACERDDYCTH